MAKCSWAHTSFPRNTVDEAKLNNCTEDVSEQPAGKERSAQNLCRPVRAGGIKG